MAAPSVLDVGCGTGRLLHRAREAGHAGRLCGVDPDVAALERGAGGPVSSGSRPVRAWEGWNWPAVRCRRPRRPRAPGRPPGRVGGRRRRDPHRDDRPAPATRRVDGASLRFLDVEGIDAFLGDAGFEVEARYDDWSRMLIGASDGIVTVARAP